MNQYPYSPMQSGINGMYVDNRQVVDATQCDLSGKPLFFPTTDGQTIYSKQLDPMGKSHVTTYSKQFEPEICEKFSNNGVKMQDLDILVSKIDELSEKIDKLNKPTRIKKEAEE